MASNRPGRGAQKQKALRSGGLDKGAGQALHRAARVPDELLVRAIAACVLANARSAPEVASLAKPPRGSAAKLTIDGPGLPAISPWSAGRGAHGKVNAR